MDIADRKVKARAGQSLLSLFLAFVLGLTAGSAAWADPPGQNRREATEDPRQGYQKGDPDRDGSLTIKDVMEACKLLARRTAGLESDRALVWSCELTGDDQVTVADVMELCKRIVRGGRPADIQIETAHGRFGRALIDQIQRDYLVPQQDYVLEQQGGTQPAFLWPYTAYLNALAASVRFRSKDPSARRRYASALKGLMDYDTNRETPDQSSFAAGYGGAGDVYYDDNMWVILILLEAYEITEEPACLELSQQTAAFCYMGWDDRLGGGVYWCESNKATKNTCSNAPLALASARLYQFTGRASYLRWAEQIYAWTRSHLRDPADGLYYDHLTLDGILIDGKYACNAGCMLLAALELYESTGKEGYLADARELAAASDAYFFTRQEEGFGFSQAAPDAEEPWFYVWLLEGLARLSENDRTAPTYIEHVKQAVWRGWTARDAQGRPIPVFKPADGGPSLIDACGMAQVFMLLDAWYDLRN